MGGSCWYSCATLVIGCGFTMDITSNTTIASSETVTWIMDHPARPLTTAPLSRCLALCSQTLTIALFFIVPPECALGVLCVCVLVCVCGNGHVCVWMLSWVILSVVALRVGYGSTVNGLPAPHVVYSDKLKNRPAPPLDIDVVPRCCAIVINTESLTSPCKLLITGDMNKNWW